MKTLKQLIRQPIKTLAGLILMVLASSIVCLCAGQALAARATKAELDSRFSTAAIPSVQEDLEGQDQIRVDHEMIDWLGEMALQHPDIVQGVIEHSILSASIPELLPFNQNAESVSMIPTEPVYSSGTPTLHFQNYTSSNSYDSAMLVISLEQIGQVYSPTHTLEPMAEPNRRSYSTEDEYCLARAEYARYKQLEQELQRIRQRGLGYAVELTGTVTQVVQLQEGLRNPTGLTARLFLIMPTLEDIEALHLEVGQQYIVYGMDYNDDDRELVASMKLTKYKHVDFEHFDPSLLKEPTEQMRIRYNRNSTTSVEIMYDSVPLTLSQYRMLNAISMTMCMPSTLVDYDRVLDENGNVVQIDFTPEISYTELDGTVVSLPVEEYNNRYAVPTIAKLDGSLEDFFSSAAGESWQKAINRDQINHHAFSVIGVENMDYLATFALGKSKIGEGREFTPEEVENGARVCIVHERVAQMAGLQIGDTITLNFYGTDHGQPFVSTRAEGKGLLCPNPSLYLDSTPVLETAEYTVVGFWQGDGAPDVTQNYYSFNANTVFVPQSSVAVAMEQVNTIPFVVGKLENGMINEFHNLAKRSGYAGCFKYCDQDFTKIAANFHNYTDLARQILLIGMVLYVVLMLLFVLLYPLSQYKTVWTMQSLGCNYARCAGHVLVSAMALVIPASVLGGVLGASLWERVVSALQATAESSVALQLPAGTMGQLVLVQVAFSLVLNMAVAIVVAAPRGISKRR